MTDPSGEPRDAVLEAGHTPGGGVPIFFVKGQRH